MVPQGSLGNSRGGPSNFSCEGPLYKKRVATCTLRFALHPLHLFTQCYSAQVSLSTLFNFPKTPIYLHTGRRYTLQFFPPISLFEPPFHCTLDVEGDLDELPHLDVNATPPPVQPSLCALLAFFFKRHFWFSSNFQPL